MSRKLTHKEFENRVKNVNSNFRLGKFFFLTEYLGTKKPITIKCSSCGDELKINKAGYLLKKENPYNCKVCGNAYNRKFSHTEFLIKLKDKYDSFKSEKLILVTEYLAWNKPITLKCTECGEVWSVKHAGTLLEAYSYDCKYCGDNNNSNGNILLNDIFEKYHFFAKREFQFPEFKGRMAYDGAIWNESHSLLLTLKNKDDFIIPKSLTYSPEILIEFDGWQHFEMHSFGSKNYEYIKHKFKNQIKNDNYKNKKSVEEITPLLRIPPIYDPIKDAKKIEQMVLDFKRTKKVPQEILDFYAQYEFSNYVECVKALENKLAKVA